MKNIFCKTLISILLVITMLFMFCVSTYADNSAIEINDKGSPVIQSDIMIDTANESMLKDDVMFVEKNSPIIENLGTELYYNDLPKFYQYGISEQTVHIDPGR